MTEVEILKAEIASLNQRLYEAYETIAKIQQERIREQQKDIQECDAQIHT
jgi:hypothetical protein